MARAGDPYGESRAEAEARLIQLVRSGLPLPLASIRNRRSLLSLTNLADLVQLCIAHPRATEQPLLAADADAPSTPELVRRVAAALHRPARLFPLPPALLELAAMPLGLRGVVTRLARSQALNYSTTTALIGWKPAVATRVVLAEACQAP